MVFQEIENRISRFESEDEKNKGRELTVQANVSRKLLFTQ